MELISYKVLTEKKGRGRIILQRKAKGDNMNIDEIAKMAGVSRTTVSRYLNGGYVGGEKKERIGEVIRKTGYRPLAQAQTLRTKKTGQIGVILPKINSDSISEMVEGISSVLSSEGYFLLLANTESNESAELNYFDIFSRNKVDGIILIGTVITPKHREVFAGLSVPFVVAAQQVNGFSCVYYDDYGAAYALTNLLLEKGKVPGYIGVREDDKAAGYDRKSGFLAALAEHGIHFDESYGETALFSLQSGYEQAAELFSRHADIDSLFCATDHIAAGALLCLKGMGRRVPEDVRVAGVGDGKISRVTSPTLTSAHLYYNECGRKAARILLEQIGGDSVVQEVRLGFQIVERGSTSMEG